MIPARHGTATFVPAGQTIKIVNTSGTQVIDTWAFALPEPEEKKSENDAKEAEKPKQDDAQKSTPAKFKKKGDNGLPSQEEAEKATQQGLQEGQEAGEDGNKKSGWGSYVPSLGWSSSKKGDAKETTQQKNSKTWASYFPSGQGFSNYIPKSATDTVSSFAATVRLARMYLMPSRG